MRLNKIDHMNYNPSLEGYFKGGVYKENEVEELLKGDNVYEFILKNKLDEKYKDVNINTILDDFRKMLRACLQSKKSLNSSQKNQLAIYKQKISELNAFQMYLTFVHNDKKQEIGELKLQAEMQDFGNKEFTKKFQANNVKSSLRVMLKNLYEQIDMGVKFYQPFCNEAHEMILKMEKPKVGFNKCDRCKIKMDNPYYVCHDYPVCEEDIG